jgi:tetratricopeptide (TPR) repeat protein
MPACLRAAGLSPAPQRSGRPKARGPGRCVLLLLAALAGCTGAPPAESVASGDRAMDRRDWLEAVRQYQKAVEHGASTDLFVKLGRAHLEAGQLPAAAQALGRALEKDPNCERCYALLGLIAIEDRQLTRAEELLRNALHFDPSDVGARNNLGFVYLLRRDLPRAYECYLQSVAFAPDDPVANVNLGRLCRDFLRDNACARQHFNRYLAASPGGSEAVEIRAWLQAEDDRRWSEGPQALGTPDATRGGQTPSSAPAPASAADRPEAHRDAAPSVPAVESPTPPSATAGPLQAAPIRSPAPAAESTPPPTAQREESADFYLEMARQWERKASSSLEVEVALRYAHRALELRRSAEAEALVSRLEHRLGKPPESGVTPSAAP